MEGQPTGVPADLLRSPFLVLSSQPCLTTPGRHPLQPTPIHHLATIISLRSKKTTPNIPFFSPFSPHPNNPTSPNNSVATPSPQTPSTQLTAWAKKIALFKQF
jgi:hypothetical protein